MAKTYLGEEINFNETPIFWKGVEVYPGNGATANVYATLNVVKSSNEPTTPDINTDGKLSVKGESTFESKVTINAVLQLKDCGNVASRIDQADSLPSSDKSLKTNITPIENALSKVLQLNGVEFDFIEGSDLGHLKTHQIGLIAQDVEKVIPEVVGKTYKGTLGVSYQHLVSLLIEAIKEQQEQIDELKNIINQNK